MRIINKTKNSVLAENAMVADTFFKRLRGLLGRKNFNSGEGLVIKPCKWIQTFFMHFSVDVIFVDAENKVIAVKSFFKPWRISPFYWQAKFVIEVPCGTLLKSLTEIGDTIELIQSGLYIFSYRNLKKFLYEQTPLAFVVMKISL